MKRAEALLLLALAAGSAALTGCDAYGDGEGYDDEYEYGYGYDDDDGSGVVFVGLEFEYLTYSNGHPIAVASDLSWQEDEMIQLINHHRVASGQNALVVSSGMLDVTAAHAIHMDLHGFVGELNPEGDDPADRAYLAGVPYVFYDEITGAGSDDPWEMFDAWALTPMHDLIHDPWITHFGVGHHAGSWAVDFAER